MLLSRPASFLRSLPLFSPRSAHFLASVPLKKDAHDGLLPKDYFDNKKPVLLYFSAGWCPSCRVLTPKLAKFYEKVGKDRGLEVVWVSRDKAEEDLEEYYRKLPDWSYIPFGDENIRGFLDKYDVKTIPAMKLVNEQGSVLLEEARKDVEENWKHNPDAIMDRWNNLYE